MIRVLPGKLAGYSNIVCGTTMRFGGVSKKQFSGLNLGDHVGDKVSSVIYNRALFSSYLEAKYGKLNSLYFLKQGHTNNLLQLSDSAQSNDLNDAVWTDKTQVPLVIMTADCLPIMLTDGNKICAIHAGWKGLENDLLAKAIKIFSTPFNVVAWIGPHIRQSNYEIGTELKERFNYLPEAIKPSREKGKFMLDLTLVAKKRLQSLGVETIHNSSICTYDDNRFYSHRRSVHSGSKTTGRMVTFIIKKK